MNAMMRNENCCAWWGRRRCEPGAVYVDDAGAWYVGRDYLWRRARRADTVETLRLIWGNADLGLTPTLLGAIEWQEGVGAW